VRTALTQLPAAQAEVDALAVPVATGEQLGGAAAELDQALGGILRDILERGEHRGRVNEVLSVHPGGRITPRRVLLYGVGARADLDGQRMRFAHHEMVRAARNYGYSRIGILRAGAVTEGQVAAAIEGSVMGGWERRSRQTGPRPARLDELVLVGFGNVPERDIHRAQEVGDAVNQAREWTNMPANELTPEALAQEARKIADRHGLEMEVLGPA